MAPKSTLHVGIVGQTKHGKTTVTSALRLVSTAIYGAPSGSTIHEAMDVWAEGVRIRVCEVHYESLSRRYVHTDYATEMDLLKSLVVRPRSLDGIILVVSAAEGVTAQATESLALARAAGVPCAVGFINKVDIGDAVAVGLLAAELAHLMTAHGYPRAPILRGSALAAVQALADGHLRHPEVKGIRRLVQAMDDHLTIARDHAGIEGNPASSTVRSPHSQEVAA